MKRSEQNRRLPVIIESDPACETITRQMRKKRSGTDDYDALVAKLKIRKAQIRNKAVER